jgi:undecaprenyl-diphosphatase
MTFLDATILGIVEGLTEFLPISSTGHLILTARILNLSESEATKAFEVVIQLAAILAVIFHYRERLSKLFLGLWKKEASSLYLFTLLTVAFLPAAILGFIFGSAIKKYLFGIWPVIAALSIGGLLMIFIERRLKQSTMRSDDLSRISVKEALIIGFAQSLALWPGTSRSMATMMAGRLLRFSAKQAAEFSFLLSIPVLAAASLHDLVKYRSELIDAFPDWRIPAVGLFFSFASALIVIRIFLRFLSTHSMEVFGWYRIALAAICFMLF